MAAVGPKAVKGRWATPLPAPPAQPFELVLTGPAGGTFSRGVDGEHVEIDALEFIRTLSGRLPGTGVLSHSLPL